MPILKTGVFYWWIALLSIVLDIATKLAVMAYVPFRGMIDIFPFLAITHVYNEGAAFSFLADMSGWQGYFFIGVAAVASVAIITILYKRPRTQKLLCVSLALVLGGAIGNLIDRIAYGHVVDFILFYVRGVFTYPAFNIADCAICIGVALLIIHSFFFDKDNKKERA